MVSHAAAERLDPARDQRGRTAERHLAAHPRPGQDVRAGHAAVQHVAHDPHLQPLERAQALLERVEVEQRLRGVLVLAVAGVDHRRARPARHQRGRPHLRRADHDRGRVVGRQGLDGVLERLALVHRRAARLDAHQVGGEALGRQLEARAGARGGLVEEVDHRAPAQRGHLLDLAARRPRRSSRRGRGCARCRRAESSSIESRCRFMPGPPRARRLPPRRFRRSPRTRTFTLSSRAVGRFLPT